MKSQRCSYCNNPTLDPSGRCHLHRGTRLTLVPASSSPSSIPTPIRAAFADDPILKEFEANAAAMKSLYDEASQKPSLGSDAALRRGSALLGEVDELLSDSMSVLKDIRVAEVEPEWTSEVLRQIGRMEAFKADVVERALVSHAGMDPAMAARRTAVEHHAEPNSVPSRRQLYDEITGAEPSTLEDRSGRQERESVVVRDLVEASRLLFTLGDAVESVEIPDDGAVVVHWRGLRSVDEPPALTRWRECMERQDVLGRQLARSDMLLAIHIGETTIRLRES